MRLRTIASIALATGLVALLYRRARRQRRRPLIPDIDPKDPLQSLDDVVVLHVEELEVEVMPEDLAALSDLDALSPELDQQPPRTIPDSGELYGVHTVAADDRVHPDDDTAQAGGENWVEALMEDSVEGGPTPEHIVDVLDEDDLKSPPTDTRDRPIADRGSAGRRGL